jgi:hypothetical protein
MQLKIARLCLDCDEVHQSEHCPVCASEAFGYLTRWVPSPERRMRPRPTNSPAADVYRELISPSPGAPKGIRLLARSALGVTALGLAGWIWRRKTDGKNETPDSAKRGTRQPKTDFRKVEK